MEMPFKRNVCTLQLRENVQINLNPLSKAKVTCKEQVKKSWSNVDRQEIFLGYKPLLFTYPDQPVWS